MSLLPIKKHIDLRIHDASQTNKRFGGSNPLDKLLSQLKGNYDQNSINGKNVDRINVAVNKFIKSPSLLPELFRHICWGLLHESDDNSIILNHDRLFNFVIEESNRRINNNRLYLTHYRGLISAYWKYDEKELPDAKKNWASLKRFLKLSLPEITKNKKTTPDWVGLLLKYPELLSDDPCKSIMSGGFEDKFNEISDGLHRGSFAPPNSWIFIELLSAQIDYVCKCGDVEYLNLLPKALDLIRKDEVFADAGLKRILARHEGSLRDSPHEGLLNFSVEKWGSPSLYSSAQWGLVSENIKSMISTWLAENDMRDFFSVLKGDSDMDNRRLDFWLNYSQSIQGTKFVLGNNTFESRQQTIVDLKIKKKDRISKLVGGGQANNNAFILYIGNLIFIEFGQTGNAVYVFRKDSMQVDLSKDALHINYHLKHSSKLTKMSHVDRKYDTWEDDFASYLARNKILPNNKLSPSGSILDSAKTSLEERIWNYITNEGLSYKDHRDKPGGCLWVYHNNDYDLISERLFSFGFLYAENKGFWKKGN